MSSMHAGSPPVVICVAPNGARRGKADHARLPMTAAELADEAAQIVEAGAHVLHLHVRDAQGRHSLDPELYREAIAAIRARVGDDLLVQVTTESAGLYRAEQQVAVIRNLVPRYMSMAIRELIPDESHESAAAGFLAWAAQQAIGIQFILYTAADVAALTRLHSRGLIAVDRPHGLFVVGRHAVNGLSNPRDLLTFIADWPMDWPWTVCAFGRTEPLCLAAAIALGGHVRVGFENNLMAPDGTLAKDNAASVTNVRQMIECTGRPLATRDEAGALYRT
ncbi:uncharacterized protein (DUF849 family) [Povalibacter uvarum]|uniref:Uncharacterized protein (DUF849 family) n=1 Tax=Povalibacter uvarum TaxID=732238 RepID=A0A841HXI1_9GAMM|nr:3-keto-5-aminohexanoate cleavage protein [Povalibacter uvarum]MBB6096505.1 uncharacterized protein (DUF849 family) [Povalibacter uvarum]